MISFRYISINYIFQSILSSLLDLFLIYTNHLEFVLTLLIILPLILILVFTILPISPLLFGQPETGTIAQQDEFDRCVDRQVRQQGTTRTEERRRSMLGWHAGEAKETGSAALAAFRLSHPGHTGSTVPRKVQSHHR